MSYTLVSATDPVQPRFLRLISAIGIAMIAKGEEPLATTPQILWGDGVPAVAAPNGSVAIRRDGANMDEVIYARQGGAWVAFLLSASAPMDFKGGVTLPADFPTAAAVQSGDYYTALADVTDNDATKTNTGDSFIAGDEFVWNGAGWTNLGTLRDHAGTHDEGGADPLTDLPAAAVLGGTARLVSEVAAWLDQDVTIGSSPTLDASNLSGVGAAGLDANTDQDVKSGAAPVLAVTNMTGSAAGLDSDATAHAASNGTSHANVVLNDTHRASAGADHADVVTNSAHVAGDGSDHADVAANTVLTAQATTIARGTVELATTAEVDTGTDTDRAITPDALNGSAPVLSVANITGTRAGIDSDSATHIAADGKDHSDVVLNNTHRASSGVDHANVVLNDTHRTGDGSDHADVATNSAHVAGDGSDHADVAANTVLTAQATEGARGTLEIATQAETNAGADDTRALTPKKLKDSSLVSALPSIISKQITTGDLTESGNGVVQEINFDDVIPGGAPVLSRWIDLDTEFSGGGVVSVDADFGDGVDDDGYYSAEDVFTGAGTGPKPKPSTPGALIGAPTQGGFAADIADGDRTPSVTFDPDGAHNLAQLTAGDLTAYVLYIDTPTGPPIT